MGLYGDTSGFRAPYPNLRLGPNVFSVQGISAYQIAVRNGYEGTEEVDGSISKDEPTNVKQVLSVKEISPVKISVEKEMTTEPIYNKVIKQK